MSTASIELVPLPPTSYDPRPGPSRMPSAATSVGSHMSDTEPYNAVSLPPMDRGFHACAYLGGAFMIELLVWAYPFSYGVFLNHYTAHTFKDNKSALLPLVGSLSTGIIYLSSLAILPFITRYPTQKKNLMYLGVAFCIGGLLGAAFSTEPWQLVLTQGLIYSIGGSFLYFPVMSYLWEWFAEKKGLANGIMFSGTGVGGVVVPFVIETLLKKYGQRTTFIALAVAFAVLILPVFPFIKPRVPVAQKTARTNVDVRFMRYGPFAVLFVANLIQGLATFLPNIYIPTFSRDLGLSDKSGTLVLSLMNAASCPGTVLLGYLSDRYDLRYSMVLSTVGSASAVLFIWGFSTSVAPLIVFAIIYGFLAPSWSALWPRFVSIVVGDDTQLSTTVMSTFIAGRGIGNVLSAPISDGLLHPWAMTDKSHFAYSLKGYGPLITFTGIALLVSTLGVAYRGFEHVGANWKEVRLPRREDDDEGTSGRDT